VAGKSGSSHNSFLLTQARRILSNSDIIFTQAAPANTIGGDSQKKTDKKSLKIRRCLFHRDWEFVFVFVPSLENKAPTHLMLTDKGNNEVEYIIFK
jgi:hypothetical protein